MFSVMFVSSEGTTKASPKYTCPPQAHLHFPHPVEILERGGELVAERIYAVVVYGGGGLVHEVHDGAAQVREVVVGNVEGDEGRRHGIGPPQPELDPYDPHHGGACGEPLGLVHLGVGA